MNIFQMLEFILNILSVLLGVAVLVYVVIVTSKSDNAVGHCDYDCRHCPFPPCDTEECGQNKQEEKDDIHNR